MLLTVLFVAAALSLPAHSYLRNFTVACAVTAVVSTGLVWATAPQHFGWFDRTFYENLFICGLTSVGASVAVGLWLKSREKRH